MTGPGQDKDRPPQLADDSPTELVETDDGDLVERLSGATATLLLAWLIGIGAATALIGVWIFVWIISGTRMGVDTLFSSLGFYVALAGASGPCILWLAGRAQSHSLGWFAITAAKIGAVMVAITVAVGVLAALVLGRLPGFGALVVAAFMLVGVLLISQLWGLAVWSADRHIARARVRGG
ncbi:MAG: hypothetical protein M3R05_03615 [Chloroflexota bacterium]|nr:hypothetical protein [Chloroflexota bacterium]